MRYIIYFVLFVFATPVLSQTAQEFVQKGVEEAKAGNHKEAVKNFDYAIKMSPSDYNIYVYRAFAKESLKDYSGAIADYDKALLFNKNDPNIYYNRALTKYTSGDKKNACIDWQKAIDLGMKEALFIIQLYCN